MWGGPGHGNVVSSSEDSFAYHELTMMWLDGPTRAPSENLCTGYYRWSHHRRMYIWDGPGADGDTIERLRLE